MQALEPIVANLTLESDITAGGFFTVNRAMFTSFLTTVVTYLIILLQFEITFA